MLAPVCAGAFILGIERTSGFANTVTLPKGPNYSCHVFPRREGSPTAGGSAAGAVLGWWLGVCGQKGVAVGTMAGMWETGRGTSTAQEECAALSTTTLVTPLNNTGDAIAQQSQPVEKQVATRSSLKEIPWKY